MDKLERMRELLTKISELGIIILMTIMSIVVLYVCSGSLRSAQDGGLDRRAGPLPDDLDGFTSERGWLSTEGPMWA